MITPPLSYSSFPYFRVINIENRYMDKNMNNLSLVNRKAIIGHNTNRRLEKE